MFEEVIERFSQRPAEVAIGPSMLESLAWDGGWGSDSDRIVLPEEMLRLAQAVAEGSAEHRAFLGDIVKYFRDRWTPDKQDEDYERTAQLISEAVLNLARDGHVITLGGDSVDPLVQQALAEAYPQFEIALSPKAKFLRDYLVKIYSWSKKTGGVVVDRTRKVFTDLGHFVVTLQIPDRADKLIGLKADFFGRIFRFRGGRATKYFVAVVLIFGQSNPLLAGAGIVITFMDP